MGKPDKQIILILIAFATIFLSVCIAGLLMDNLLNYISLCNVICGLVIIIYWIQHEIKITQHYADIKEIFVLCFESLVVGISVYTIAVTQVSSWIKITQYIIFGSHFTSLIAFLIFMFTFKMKKLF